MKIGQAFFKLNKEDRLSTFAEHKFDVIKVFGVEENKLGNVNLVVSIFKSTVSEIENYGNKKSSTIDLNTSFASFLKLSDSDQNNIIESELGYFDNSNKLINEHRSFTINQISIERDFLSNKEIELQRIENSF